MNEKKPKVIFVGIYCCKYGGYYDLCTDEEIEELKKQGFVPVRFPCESTTCERCPFWDKEFAKKLIAFANMIELAYSE